MQSEGLSDHEVVKLDSPEIASKEISADDSSVYIDPDEERRLVKKLDSILLPLFTLIYCCNFIDRTAIGVLRISVLHIY